MFNIYLISAEVSGKKYYKIGYTRRKVEERVREFKTGNASDFEIVDSFRSEWGTRIESLLHRDFRPKKIQGEWFDLSESDVLNFNKMCQKYHNNFSIMVNSNTYIMDRIEKGKQRII